MSRLFALSVLLLKVPWRIMLDQQQILNVLLQERNRIFTFAWSIVRNVHTAEDVFQETMIKSMNQKKGFENEAQLLGWSRTVTRNRCFDIVYKEKNRRNILEKSVTELIQKDLDERDMEKEEKNISVLKECLSGLTDNSREIIKLRYFHSMQAKKVAEHLDRKPDAVYKSLQRIYQKLRDCISSKSLAGGVEI